MNVLYSEFVIIWHRNNQLVQILHKQISDAKTYLRTLSTVFNLPLVPVYD